MKPIDCEVTFSKKRNAYTAVFDYDGEGYFADFSRPADTCLKSYLTIYPVDENNHIVAEFSSYKTVAMSFNERTLRNLIEGFCKRLDDECE